MHLLITIFISTLIVILMPIKWFGLKSYMYSFPMIIFCVGVISKKVDTQLSRDASSLGFLIPVIGYTAWKNAVIRLDSQYLAFQIGPQQQLTILEGGMDGVLVLLLGTSVATFMWKSKKMGGLFLCTLGCAALCKFLLKNAVLQIWHGDPSMASSLVLYSELLRSVPILLAIALCYKAAKYTRWLLIVGGITCGWMVCPPLASQLQKIPVADAHPEGPTGTLGVGISTSAANPLSENFAQELNAQGTRLLPSLQWWCNTKNRARWQNDGRAAAGISPPGKMTIAELWPHLPQIFQRGITYLAIVGKTEETASIPLKKHLQTPAVRFYLDPPPLTSVFGVLDGGELQWSKPLPEEPEACAVWVTKETNIQELFTNAQRYATSGQPCAHKLFLIFGTPEEDLSSWRSPIKCTKNPIKNPRGK